MLHIDMDRQRFILFMRLEITCAAVISQKKSVISSLMYALQKTKNLFRLFAFYFCNGVWAFGISMYLVGGLRWWSGDQFFPVRLCNYLMPWLLMGLLAAGAVSFLINRKYLTLLLIVPALFMIITYAPLFLPGPEGDHEGFHLKVMSYNVWRENSNIAGMAEVIREQKPDLILLQEIHRDKLTALVAKLDDLYFDQPYVNFEEQKLQAIISHFPLQRVDAGTGKGRAQKAVVTTPVGPITVLNIHPLRGGWQRRHKQMIALIADDIVGDSNPLILGGDFNTTDQSQTYQLLGPLLKNSHWQAGWGFGFTYPTSSVKFFETITLPPLVRIDHIFHSKHFVAQKASTLADSGGSDHFPVLSELILKSGSPGLDK